jgi:hypothetical protein
VHQDARYTLKMFCTAKQHEPHKIKKLTSHKEKSAFDITYSVV